MKKISALMVFSIIAEFAFAIWINKYILGSEFGYVAIASGIIVFNTLIVFALIAWFSVLLNAGGFNSSEEDWKETKRDKKREIALMGNK